MDSSTSDSIQSSGGGGGEEFDSRSESFSTFLNFSSTSNQACADISSTIQQSAPPPPPPPSRLPFHQQNHPSPIFDPLSTYFDIFSQTNPPATPNSLLNLDMVLSRGFTSPTSSPTTGGLMSYSPSPHRMPNQSFMPSPSGHEHSSRASALSNVGVRNPKKRTRASRRAPTTVLTTDTSNFRAMVQEFTGIPPPPFATSPFLGNRLNLFNTSSNMRSGMEPSIPYALRPFAHKVLPPSFLASMIASSNSGAHNNISPSTNITTTTSSSSNTNNPTPTYNFQLPSELGLPRQSQNSTNTQNPLLTLQQSHLEPSPRYPSSSLPFFSTKSQTSSGMNSALEEFGIGHGQLDADQLGNATKSLHEEWVVTEKQH